jgi:hypothetical protein
MFLARSALIAIALVQLSFEPQTKGTPLIGVTEVSRLLRVYGPAGEPVVPGNVRIPLRARPAADSPVIATITKPDDLTTVEYAYEELAAMVYARQGTWSLVKTADGVAGWMAAEDAGTFHGLQALLEDHMAYLTAEWDGTLFAAPGMTDRAPIADDPDRRLAGYVEPNVPDVRVVLQPGQDSEEVRSVYREAYRATGLGSGPGPDGTRILRVEPGVIVPLFENPNAVTVIAHVQTNRAGEVLQTTHQTPPQVLVFETRAGWYQVARENNYGEWRTAPRLWLQASPMWRFRPLSDGPQMKALAQRAWGPESRDVRVTAMRTIDGALWAEVELLYEHDCASIDKPVARARGWLPAHAPSGNLNVWYYPRGC